MGPGWGGVERIKRKKKKMEEKSLGSGKVCGPDSM